MHADDWIGTIAAVRRKTDLIVQCGMSSLTIPQRMDVFEQGADMISIITSHHDEAFVGLDMNELHSREELAEYARLSREFGVQLEYETWHEGWHLEPPLADRARADRCAVLHEPLLRLAGRVVVAADHRGVPAPAPPRCRRAASRPSASWPPSRCRILAAAIVQGDHVRVGTEDYPFDRAGNLAETHQLVSEVAEIARAVGREIATPAQAREIVGTRSLAR